MESVTIGVQGMSCAHCKKAVEEALMTLDGVCDAEVNLDAKNVRVDFDKTKTSEEKIKEAISGAGYEV
ncbi:MAG: copper ion binding protein [Bacillota bacterium]